MPREGAGQGQSYNCDQPPGISMRRIISLLNSINTKREKIGWQAGTESCGYSISEGGAIPGR